MEEAQLINADATLEPLLQMAKTSSKNADTTHTLVLKALSDPSIFCGFDQLKNALNLGSDSALGRTLDLFSYGTFLDYKTAEAGQFVTLSESHLNKLRQLTALTIVQKACFDVSPVVPYTTIAHALALDNQIDVVEETMISCITAGMVVGQLCQKTQSFHLSLSAPCRSRDVPPSSIPQLLARLQQFSHRLDTALSQMAKARRDVQVNKEADEAFWKKVGEGTQSSQRAVASMSSYRALERPTARSSNKRSRGGMVAGDLSRF